jgi:hypothetical protein
MLVDGIKLFEGSSISNASVETGTTFPTTANAGELFFKTTDSLLYVYTGSAWASTGSGGGSSAASALTGTTLASNVVSSSLTSVGTLGSLVVTGTHTQTGALNLAGTTSSLQLQGSAGTSGQVLTSAGTGTTPTWQTASSGAASTLTGTSLASNVVSSSLTSVGTLGSLSISSGLTLGGGSAISTTGTTGYLQFGYVNSDITSVQDAYVAWAGASANTTQSVGGNGTLLLAGRNNTNTGISLVTGGTSRLYISAQGGWGLSGANYGTTGQILTSNGNAAPTWQSAAAGAASTLTGTTLAANVVSSSLTSVGTLGSLTVTGNVTAADPTVSTHLATKSYVDTAVNGLTWKNAVGAATTANISLTGVQTIDGVSVVAGTRVLVKDQTTATQNGIYVAAAGSWTRSTDMDGAPSVGEVNGAAVYVIAGTTNASTSWTQTATITTVGSQAMVFALFAAGVVNASTVTGTTLAANVVTSSLTSVGTLSSLAVTGTHTQTGAFNLAGAASPLQVGASAGTAGQVLTSAGAGATPTWSLATVGAAGADTQIQYNNAGALAGSSLFTWTNGTQTLQLGSTAGATATITTASTTGVAGQTVSSINITTGTSPSSANNPGNITIAPGAWTPSNNVAGAPAGSLNLSGAAGTGAASGGPVNITGGNGGSTGGYVNIAGGTGDSTSGAGYVNITGGASTVHRGGSINITGGTGAASGTGLIGGGSIFFSTAVNTTVTERLRIDASGAFGLSGANYGTSGQVLTSAGSSAAPTWSTFTFAGSALTGTSLASNIVSSSLTSVGNLTSLTVAGGTVLGGSTVQVGSSGTVGAVAASTIALADWSTAGTNQLRYVLNHSGSGVMGLGGNNSSMFLGQATSPTSLSPTQWFTVTSSLATVPSALNVVGNIQLNGSTGTAGQVLASNGASAPTWQTNSVAGSALTGTSLASTIVSSSLTSVGTLTSLSTGLISGSAGASFGSSTSVPLNGSAGSLQVGFVSGTITSAQDCFVGWAGTATTFNVGNANGTLLLASRNTGSAGVSIATGGANRLYIESNGGWGLGGANYGTSGQVITSNGTGAAPTWQTIGVAASALTGTTLAATVVSSSLTSVAAAATVGGIEIGYRNLPRVTTLDSTARGKRVALAAGTNIPGTSYSDGVSIAVGDIVSFYNNTGGTVTLTAAANATGTAGTAPTMYKDGTAASVTSVSLAARGSCTIWYNTATEVVVGGSIA